MCRRMSVARKEYHAEVPAPGLSTVSPTGGNLAVLTSASSSSGQEEVRPRQDLGPRGRFAQIRGIAITEPNSFVYVAPEGFPSPHYLASFTSALSQSCSLTYLRVSVSSLIVRSNRWGHGISFSVSFLLSFSFLLGEELTFREGVPERIYFTTSSLVYLLQTEFS